MVEDVIDIGVIAVGGRRELLDDLHRGIDALVLVPVDARLDEDRDLHVALEVRDELLRLSRVVQGIPAHRHPVIKIPLLLIRFERVDRDLVHVSSQRRLSRYLDGHPPAALRLNRLERAADRIPGDVREASNRIARRRPVREVPGRVWHGCAAPGRCDRRAGSARRHEECGKHRKDEQKEDAGPGQRGPPAYLGDPDGDRRSDRSKSLGVPVSRRHGAELRLRR